MSEINLDPLYTAYLRLGSEVSEGHSERIKLIASMEPNSLRSRIAKEPQFRSVIDDACRDWIKTHYWNVTGEIAALLVWDRIWEGHFFATTLWTSGLRAPNRTEQEMLHIFLIHSWPAYGLSRLKARLIPSA